jgi:hypothetical protein
LYKKALAGEIKEFTGVSDPYEPPDDPEVICETEKETPTVSARKIIRKLEELGYLTPMAQTGGDGVLAAAEREAVKSKLAEFAPV